MNISLLTFVAVASLVTVEPLMVLGQTSAVTNAILNQRSGLLDKARVDIDKAILNEKTSGKAKTWFTRGQVYEGMLESPIYVKQLQLGEGLNKAFESYSKTIELDTKDGEFGKQAMPRMDALYGRAFNDAVNSYNAKDYDKAIGSYKLASQIKPQDTTAVLYSAYAFEAKSSHLQQLLSRYIDKSPKGDSVNLYKDEISKSLVSARSTYNSLLDMKYKSAAVYNRLLQIARQQNDKAEASKVLQQALLAYPNDKNFMLEDLNVSLAGGKGEDAIAKINKTIAGDPTNSNLYAVRGSLYDQQKKTDLAVADYRKAIELDPKNFDAQYNLGVYNYNKAADSYTKASKMDLKSYQISGRKLEADGKKYFEAAVPFFERGLELQPNDRNTLTSLKKIYFRLGRTSDSGRLQARIDVLDKK